MNIALLNEIKKVFREEPRRLDMRDWLDIDVPRHLDGPPCGTVGCIAGWATVLSKRKWPRESLRLAARRAKWDYSSEDEGTRALDLTRGQARRLFYPDEWPAKIWRAYENANSTKARVAATIKRINLFIRSKGRK